MIPSSSRLREVFSNLKSLIIILFASHLSQSIFSFSCIPMEYDIAEFITLGHGAEAAGMEEEARDFLGVVVV